MKNIFLAILFTTTILSAQTRPPDEILAGYGTAASVVQAIAAGVTGSGIANQITYWTGTKTVGSLATSTYPSLQELARVKGVTSPIQTQFNSVQTALTQKQDVLISGQNIKSINGQSIVGSGNLTITTLSDTTGQYAKIYSIVQSIIASQSQSIIGSKATLDSMIVDFRKNNYLRLNK